MIREHGLQKLYPPVCDEEPCFVDIRRAIISRAFDVVLGRENTAIKAKRLLVHGAAGKDGSDDGLDKLRVVLGEDR